MHYRFILFAFRQTIQVSAHATIPKAAATIAVTPPDNRHAAQHATMTYFMIVSNTFTTFMILYIVSFIINTSRSVISDLCIVIVLRRFRAI